MDQISTLGQASDCLAGKPVSLAEFLTKACVPPGISDEKLRDAAEIVAAQSELLKAAAAREFPDETPWSLQRKYHVAHAAISARNAILSGKV